MVARVNITTQLDTKLVLLYLVRAGVLAVMFTPLIVSTETLFPFIVGKAIFSRSVIEVTFALWVMLAFRFPSYRLGRSWVLIALATWVAVSIIAGFAGVSLQRSLWSTYERMQGIFDQVHWLAFIVVAASVFRTMTHWKLLFSVNLAFSIVVALLGLGNHFDLIDWAILGSGSREVSTLGNATYVGAYSMVNILIAAEMIGHSWSDRTPDRVSQADLGRAARRRRRSTRQTAPGAGIRPMLMAFWFTAMVTNLWVLWLALARGALLGLVAGGIVFALIYLLWGQIKTLKRVVAYGVFPLLGLVATLFILARTTSVFDTVVESNTMLNRVVATSFDASLQGRVTAWGAGLRGYLDKPIFGWGPENYLIAWGRYFDSSSGISERFDQAHNKVLEELTTKGAVGAISYLAIWGAMGWVMVRSIRRRQEYEQIFVAFVAAAMVGFFVQNLFLFDSPVTSLQFAILVAFALGEEVHQQDEAQPDPSQPQIGTDRLAGLSNLTAWFRTPIGSATGVWLIVLVLGFSLWSFNYRPFAAATAVVRTPTTWDEQIELFRESIDGFPALANYPRMLLLARVGNNFQGMSPAELERALAFVEAETLDAMEGEPESWRVEVSLARFYQLASQRVDAAYLELARTHLDEAFRLAPRTLDIVAVLREQELLERQVSGP